MRAIPPGIFGELRITLRALPSAFLILAAVPQPGTAQSRSARPVFTDVAHRSNFSYITNNGFTGRKYFPQPLCGGVAVLDFDNDGWMDLFFTNGASFPSLQKNDAAFYNMLLRNRGDGTFEDITQRAALAGERLGFSLGAAVGDYDNDGFPDLFIAKRAPTRSITTMATALSRMSLPPRA
jgi:hypothetical protein